MEDCEEVRESLSALLDGEASRLAPEQVDAHVAGCNACHRWRDEAHVVTRQFRLRGVGEPLLPPTDLLEKVTRRSLWRPPSFSDGVRMALAGVALLQLLVTGHLLISGNVDGFRDLGSLDLALAVGYLVAALRPQRAAGMRAIVGAAAVLLVASALIDLAAHRTTALDEAPHLITLAGWLLISLLAWCWPDLGTPPVTGWGRTVDRMSIWRLSRRRQTGGGAWGHADGPAVAVDRTTPSAERSLAAGATDSYSEAVGE